MSSDCTQEIPLTVTVSGEIMSASRIKNPERNE